MAGFRNTHWRKMSAGWTMLEVLGFSRTPQEEGESKDEPDAHVENLEALLDNWRQIRELAVNQITERERKTHFVWSCVGGASERCHWEGQEQDRRDARASEGPVFYTHEQRTIFHRYMHTHTHTHTHTHDAVSKKPKGTYRTGLTRLVDKCSSGLTKLADNFSTALRKRDGKSTHPPF